MQIHKIEKICLKIHYDSDEQNVNLEDEMDDEEDDAVDD